jgi:hypothetical protein
MTLAQSYVDSPESIGQEVGGGRAAGRIAAARRMHIRSWQRDR